MEEQSIVEEFSEIIEELIDILSENSGHEAYNFAHRAMGQAEKKKRGGSVVSKIANDKVVDSIKKGDYEEGKPLKNAIADQEDVESERIYRKAFKAAKRANNDLNIKKISKMVDKAKDNGAYVRDLSKDELKTAAGLKGASDQELKKAAEEGRKRRSENKLAKIKESLETLICSNLSESTKVEILESIRNYLVD